MTRAVIYTRVSTDAQDDNFSLAAQQGACERFAAQHEITIAATVQDVMSGARLDRPGLSRVREMIRGGLIDAVLVYAADRWSRKVAHLLLLRDELRAAKVALITVTKGQPNPETPEGSLFDTIEGAFSEYEREKIRQRSMAGKRQKVLEGKHPGHGGVARYGYRFEGQGRTKELVIVPEEAEIVRQIFTWYADDGHTIADIRQRLRDRRVPTPADGGRPTIGPRQSGYAEWGRSAIYKILCDPIYAGQFIAYQGNRSGRRTPPETWLTVPVPAIVSPDIRQRAQDRLSAGRAMSPRNNQKHFYLLRCRVRCACGYSLIGTTYTQSSGNIKRSYRCFNTRRGTDGCTLSRVPQDALEDAVWSWVVADVLDEERLMLALEERQARAGDQRERLDAELSRIYTQIADVEGQAGRLAQLFTAGLYTLDEIAAEKQRIDHARAALGAAAAEAQHRLSALTLSEQDRADLLAYAGVLRATLPSLDPAQKRRIIDLLNLQVRITRGDGDTVIADCACSLVARDQALRIMSPAYCSAPPPRPARRG